MSRRGRPPIRRDKSAATRSFWGPGPADGTEPSDPQRPTPEPIRPTVDPGALPRSLGDPPLGAGVAGGLAAVYEEAVRTATALAAINGLLDMPDPD